MTTTMSAAPDMIKSTTTTMTTPVKSTPTVVPSKIVSTTTTATTTTTTDPAVLMSEQAQDVPIFLRKTYHMIDTCDPTIACWSEDGETFVVKDPIKFEKQIIPQFFKHSKFSSFVRQLNFYAFRKIKYADTIRIDPKLEAETANYWRFRHEKFLKGRPDLLIEIKRMNGQKQEQRKKAASKSVAQPASSSASAAATGKEDAALKSEVTSLKQRIEEMNKNIDELTSMVQKVTLAQKTAPATPPPPATAATQQEVVDTVINQNNKRAKVEVAPAPAPVVPDEPVSSVLMSPTPESMDLDDLTMMPPSIPSPIREVAKREASSGSELSDEGFVDQLFSAFGNGDMEFSDDDVAVSSVVGSSSADATAEKVRHNPPRPELMERLSDALALLPSDIQELIVERLIRSITSPKEIQDSVKSVGNIAHSMMAVPQSPTREGTEDETKSEEEKQANLNLAAATLAALLQHFGDEAKTKKAGKSCATAHNNGKALLIPVHA